MVLTKKYVVGEKLERYVLIPDPSLQWDEWWTRLSDDDEVEVKQFAARHGLEGKLSNNNKRDLKGQFLAFVDANTYPTGRAKEHKSSLYFFYHFSHVFQFQNHQKITMTLNYNSLWLVSSTEVSNS